MLFIVSLNNIIKIADETFDREVAESWSDMMTGIQDERDQDRKQRGLVFSEEEERLFLTELSNIYDIITYNYDQNLIELIENITQEELIQLRQAMAFILAAVKKPLEYIDFKTDHSIINAAKIANPISPNYDDRTIEEDKRLEQGYVLTKVEEQTLYRVAKEIINVVNSDTFTDTHENIDNRKLRMIEIDLKVLEETIGIALALVDQYISESPLAQKGLPPSL